MGALSYGLHPLTLLTTLHMFVNVPPDAWPQVVASDELMCLVPAWMSSQGGVVVEPDNVLSQLGILGDVHSLLPGDHAIFMLNPLRLCFFQCLGHCPVSVCLGSLDVTHQVLSNGFDLDVSHKELIF